MRARQILPPSDGPSVAEVLSSTSAVRRRTAAELRSRDRARDVRATGSARPESGSMNEHPSIPTATYRLQFNKDFTFQQARSLLPKLRALGISHVYASPYFRASPGSTHGYDVCDPNSDPEIARRRLRRYVRN